MAAFVDNISICAHARPDHGNKNDNHVTNQELCFNQWVTVVIYSYRTWPTSPSDWRLCAADDTASNPSVLRIQTAPDVFETDPAVFNNGSQSLKKTCVGATKNRFTQLVNIFLTNFFNK